MSRKKKVCHLSSVHPMFDIRIFNKECRTLARKYEVHLVIHYDKDEVLENVHIHSIRTVCHGRIQRMCKMPKLIYKKALEIDADIYHFHDPELLFVGWMLKVLYHKKVIYDSHEDVPRDILDKAWIPKPLRWIAASGIEVIEDFVTKRLDAVVAATPYIAERFSDLGVKTVDINNYPFGEELHLGKESAENDKEAQVCYIGGINRFRGIFETVQAAEKAKVVLVLAGKFSSAKEEAEVRQLTGWSCVEYPGFLDRRGVAEVLHKSVAGMILFYPLANHINAQPNKIFEYMSAGIPVIASDFPSWKKLLEECKCGLCVNPFDIDEIVQAILWIVEHPVEGAQMGKNGRRAIEEKYNWENESVKLLRLYEEV